MSTALIWKPSLAILKDVAVRWPGRELSWSPQLLGPELCERGFVAERQLHGGRFSLVVAGRWKGSPSVARLDASPDCSASDRVSRTLAMYGVSPRVLYSDCRSGVSVMDRVDPGLSGIDVQPDPTILGSLLRRMGECLRPEMLEIQSLNSFLSTRLSGTLVADVASDTPCPSSLDVLNRAADLLSTMDVGTGTIHGDCGSGNILLGASRWWLIDPRGLRGDWQFDVAFAAWKCRYSASEIDVLVRSAGADPVAVSSWGIIARAARL